MLQKWTSDEIFPNFPNQIYSCPKTSTTTTRRKLKPVTQHHKPPIGTDTNGENGDAVLSVPFFAPWCRSTCEVKIMIWIIASQCKNYYFHSYFVKSNQFRLFYFPVFSVFFFAASSGKHLAMNWSSGLRNWILHLMLIPFGPSLWLNSSCQIDDTSEKWLKKVLIQVPKFVLRRCRSDGATEQYKNSKTNLWGKLQKL